MSTDFDNSRLSHLWNHRQELNQQEWAELYALVSGILMRSRFSELADLPDERSDYIVEFFSRKVFERGMSRNLETNDAAEKEYSAAFIREAFRKFLLDKLRWQKKHQTGSLDADDDDEGCENLPEPCGCDDVNMGLLEENGLSVKRVEKSASDWLSRQESWVLLYLGLQYCPDKDQSIPLVDLAQRLAIPSYHHKARKLGLSRRKTDRLETWFRDTLLGQWLENDLAVRIERDNFDVIEAVLKILCEVSLKQAAALQNPAASVVGSV